MIDYFVICHSLDILNKLQIHLPNLQYLLVGDNHKDSQSYIRCASLSDNIEHMSKLCSFTAWYATIKNSLYHNDVVSLLEYDVEISSMFHHFNEKHINQELKNNNHNYIIAYNYTLTDHYVFFKSTPWLELSLQQTYNINLMEFVKEIKHIYPFWPTTTNITMPIHILSNFIDWFYPMTRYFANEPLGSYVQERAFFVYCIINNIKIIYLKNLLEHKQLCSHNNQDIYGQFLKNKNIQSLASCHLSEYDAIYDRCISKCSKNMAQYN